MKVSRRQQSHGSPKGVTEIAVGLQEDGELEVGNGAEKERDAGAHRLAKQHPGSEKPQMGQNLPQPLRKSKKKFKKKPTPVSHVLKTQHTAHHSLSL